MSPDHTPRERRSGRVVLLVLCLVILALLLTVVLSRVHSTNIVQHSLAADTTVRAPVQIPAAVAEPTTVALTTPVLTTTDNTHTLRDADSVVLPAAPPATVQTSERARPRTNSPPSIALTERSDSVPLPLQSATPNTIAPPQVTEIEATTPTDFIVLNVGDEELAPLNVLPSSAGPLVPLREFASLIGAVLRVADGTIALELNADDPVSATLSTTTLTGSRKQRNGVQSIAIPAAELVQRNGQWYASAQTLTALSALELSFDTRSQSIVITSSRSAIPRYAAAVRRSQRNTRSAIRDAYDESARPAKTAKIVTTGMTPTLVSLTYSLAQDNSTNIWSGQGTIGAALLGGGLSISGNLSNGNQRRRTPDVTWFGGNPLSSWLTQSRVGWGAATGLAQLPGMGVSLTNAPFSRAMGLGTLPLTGVASPNAEIEIQSGGRLLGVVTADENGRWESQVPVGFGQNLLNISAYGLDGVSRRTVLRSLEGEHLPGGKVEYGVTAQRGRTDAATCASTNCGDLANIDLRWGVSPRVTLRAGASALAPADSSGTPDYATIRATPYVTVVAAPYGWLQLRQEVAGMNWQRSRAILQPSLALRADFGHEKFAGGETAVPFWQLRRAARTKAESWASVTWRPFKTDLGKLWLGLNGRSINGTRGDTKLAGILAGTRAWSSLFTVGAEHTATKTIGLGTVFTRTRFTSTVTIPQLRRGPMWLAQSFASLSASMTPAESHTPTITAGLTSTLFRSLLIQIGTDWRLGSVPSLRLQFQQQTRAAIVSQSLNRSAIDRGTVSGSTTVLGSLLMPLNGGAPQFTSDLVALRARVRVIAFLDRDGNGLRDASEPVAQELPVLIGTRRVVTDADGVAVLDGLPVLEALAVRPDALEFGGIHAPDGSTWVLRGASPWARLAPYAETVVYLPFAVAAQVAMQLDVNESADMIWVTSLDNVDLPFTPKRVFVDRNVIVGALPPGRYRFDARRVGESASTEPWASCRVDLESGNDLRLRFPSSATESAQCERF